MMAGRKSNVVSLPIVAGSLPDYGQPKLCLLQIPPGIDNVFVPAENCVYTYADGDGETDEELIDKANRDMADSKGRVWVKDEEQTLGRLSGHTFSPPLKIEKCIAGAGKSEKGEGESCFNKRHATRRNKNREQLLVTMLL